MRASAQYVFCTGADAGLSIAVDGFSVGYPSIGRFGSLVTPLPRATCHSNYINKSIPTGVLKVDHSMGIERDDGGDNPSIYEGQLF